jgi:NAD-dependent SIR2 family protein deacetylase
MSETQTIERLAALLTSGRFAVLTGAGCSTESGIPDYRGPGTRARARNPMQYRSFVRDEAGRQRYWARSVVGWPRLSEAVPNDGHRALASMEAAGHVSGIITQNVDRLHKKAGSRAVVELHGASAEVVCLVCRRIHDRDDVQRRLLADNPGLAERRGPTAPDGDADLEAHPQRVIVPGCDACGGTLKPHVVFFGESVPRDRVDRAWKMLDESEALLVVGSSLAVYSGLRFVRGAHQRGMPIAIVNLTETRGDDLATLCVRAPAGRTLSALAYALGQTSASDPARRRQTS